ncbi:septum site-determining protein Ssd [Actinokineospora cianjurensis]|uniref:Secretion/DNA translocation related CpaE-like protein n=1 Tax=Actinokineospora cianjurensis TaxID=585224 RepID=A0A421B5X4_9PSEU|nr:septum site-determining protein Ssd [Actinokineospora cianjurensis]RLK59886.1 secretion/DNA translocation related CpaE-like protein [Actinokineospora cianjurensis]
MHRPTAWLRDESLTEHVLRLCAAAGTEPHRADQLSDVRARWPSAPLVLLDDPAAAACADAGLPRRKGVVLVVAGTPPPGSWERAVRLGAEQVVSLPEDEPWLAAALADVTEAPAGTAGRVLAVIGGTGGAGASVFATAVALTAVRSGTNALLVDCDPMGGGLDLVLGAEDEPGLRWPDVRLRTGRVPVSSLHSSLPGRTKGRFRLTLLSGAREGDGPSPDAVVAVMEAGTRAGETVVCDLPRTPDPTSRVALDRADLTVLIVPAELRAAAATRRLATYLASQGIRPSLVVRDAPHLRPPDIAKAVDLPLLASYRRDPALPARLDEGSFPLRGSLSRASKAVLHALETVPSHVR